MHVLGQTNAWRRLFPVMTARVVAVRGPLIRVISARDMSRRERKEYRDAEKSTESDSTL
jgi:uncharacterized DUF497 family protein